MADTFQSLAVVLLALLPGALYTWAFERQAGAWGIGLSDRLFRFVGASAVFHAVFARATYEVYGQVVVPGKLARGGALPWWIWLFVVAYVAVPVSAGAAVGLGTKHRQRWATLFTGPAPAPRAYDSLFSTPRLVGWVRIRLKVNGQWLLGVWGAETAGPLSSYASGYPEPEEILLVDTAESDADGNFLLDTEGNVILRGVAVLVRLDEAAYLEFVEA